ncbi:hypothetical protein C0993_009092 [Termitomyces sp. T159_Od127]|nr:hypothetical protein C0993_009092 [Termitomyces sp. T159_Od127]
MRRPQIWVDPEAATLPRSSVPRPLLRCIPCAILSLAIFSVFAVVRLQTKPYVPPLGQHKLHPRPSPTSTPVQQMTPPPYRPDPKWSDRAEKVKQAFVHAYDGYRQYALPDDELRPLSGTSINKQVTSSQIRLLDVDGNSKSLNGWGLTIFDALDTMWVMGLNASFDDALEIVADTTFVSPTVRRQPP